MRCSSMRGCGATMRNDLYILVVGNVIDGLSFIGPFDCPSDASDYAEFEERHEDWVVGDLLEPEYDEDYDYAHYYVGEALRAEMLKAYPTYVEQIVVKPKNIIEVPNGACPHDGKSCCITNRDLCGKFVTCPDNMDSE